MTSPSLDTAIQRTARELAKMRKERRAARKAERPKPPKPNRLLAQSAEGQRDPRVKEPAYLSWIRTLPCIECVRLGVLGRFKPSQAAHIRAGYQEPGWRPTGMQEKPSDRRCAPLCQEHHLDGPGAQHRANERSWWAERGIYPPYLCQALGAAYDAGEDGAAVIRMFALISEQQNPKANGE